MLRDLLVLLNQEKTSSQPSPRPGDGTSVSVDSCHCTRFGEALLTPGFSLETRSCQPSCGLSLTLILSESPFTSSDGLADASLFKAVIP